MNRPASLPVQRKKSGLASVFNRIPQLINQARLYLATTQHMASNTSPVVDYEPLDLQISVDTGFRPGKLLAPSNKAKLDLQSFKFTLEQVPAVQRVEFSGAGDPLLLGDLFKMIDWAAFHNGVETTVISDGFLLAARAQSLLNSRLDTLVVRIQAHKPSAYGAISGRPPHEHAQILTQLQSLLKARQLSGSALKIELLMTLDIHNYRELPAMLDWAEALGVDGVRIENYLGDDPAELSDRSIYREQSHIVKFLSDLKTGVDQHSSLSISWPTLLDRNQIGRRGHCKDPYSLVSITNDCSVSGCSRQMFSAGKRDKIWEAGFWNSTTYQRLREANEGRIQLPPPCQICPKNIGSDL